MRPDKEERDAMPDSDFGVPQLRKFVLRDKGNVRDAMMHFKYCPDKYKTVLANNIYDKAKETGIEVSDEGEWFQHVSNDRKKEIAHESISRLDILMKTEKYDQRKDSDYDENELEMGIKVEAEHTKSPLVAKIIAKDHLDEIPDYYTRLSKMEEDAKKELGKKSDET